MATNSRLMRRNPGVNRTDSENSGFSNKSHKIVFFSTDINNETFENTFLFMAQMAQRIGHDIVIVTTNGNRKLAECKLQSLKVYQVGQLIPKLFFGTFFLPLYCLRTIYSLFWLLKMKNDLNPSFVVVQSSDAVIPFLKLVGNLRIVQLHSFSDLELIPGTLDEVDVRRTNFHQFCIRHADEIVVQNKLSKKVFEKVFAECNKKAAVLYPCVDTSAFERCSLGKLSNLAHISIDAIVFVAFGAMRRSSNFELLINAFALLLKQIKTSYPYIYINLYLVIAGHYEDAKEYNDYSTEIQFSALKISRQRPCVLFLDSVPLQYRKSLIHRSEAVLYPMLQSLDGRTILEAGLMKKPVITVNTGIGAELVKEGVNGFILPPEPAQFARCMHSLVYSRHLEPQRARKVHNFYKKHFSTLKYSCELQDLIVRNSTHVIDSKKPTTTTSSTSTSTDSGI